MRSWIHFVIAATLFTGPFTSVARADDAALIRVFAQSASTPEQHAALADYYGGKAAAARKQAEHHRSMGKAYSAGKHFEVTRMKDHCEKLAALYESQATEFEALAQAQRELAQ